MKNNLMGFYRLVPISLALDDPEINTCVSGDKDIFDMINKCHYDSDDADAPLYVLDFDTKQFEVELKDSDRDWDAIGDYHQFRDLTVVGAGDIFEDSDGNLYINEVTAQVKLPIGM